MTNLDYSITYEDGFNTKYMTKVEIILNKLDAVKS